MLKHSKHRTTRQQNGFLLFSICFVIIIMSLAIFAIDQRLNLGVSVYSNTLMFISIAVLILSQSIIWTIRNKAFKGVKHAITHYRIVLNLRRALLDAKYYNVRLYLGAETADLPRIKLVFSSNFLKGKLMIKNIKLNKDFNDVNISYALQKYVVERKYVSDDENYHVFDIYDSSISNQIKFKSSTSFLDYSNKISDYMLFIDSSIEIPLHGSLIVGQTGSGKTYALYSLILQMLSKKTNYNLYFVDPKNSSLAVLGEIVSENNTATQIDQIIILLQRFNSLMEDRKVSIKKNLSSKLEATYEDFKYEPHILIFDEFSSFQTVLQAMEKKKRDDVMKLLTQVILQGRQLGFFLWIIMQKSDATQLPTYLRENLPVKIVLGNAEKQTYVTAFGSGVEIPEKLFELGQGVFTCPNVANTPSVCHFSYLDFDILEALNNLKT